MKRKDYGRRFPMRPIEVNGGWFYEDDEPVADVIKAWRQGTQGITVTPYPYTIGDPPLTVSPYWHVLGAETQPMGTYTISTGTNTCEAA